MTPNVFAAANLQIARECKTNKELKKHLKIILNKK